MLQMSRERPNQHPHQSYRPLPSLSSATTSSPSPPALPQRLPSLARVRGGRDISSPPPMDYRNSSNRSSSSSAAAASSPESSPRNSSYAVAQGVKRMRVAHASVHPSELVASQRQTNRREEDVFISGGYKAQRKPAQNATHELRTLRQDSAQMEYQIQVLRARWKQALPDQNVLLLACEAAKSKWITTQAEELNRQLKEQLLQQQLYLASLQNLVLHSPFFDQSRSKEVFEALHTPLRLDRALSTAQRREKLSAHCDVGIRMAPGIVSRFLQPHVAKATVEAPFSHMSIMCDGSFTFVANLLVCRIPHASLVAVTDAVGVYFDSLQREVKTHIGLLSDVKLLEQLSATSHYTQLRYENGPEITNVMNTVLASRVEDDRAVFVTDFVDADEAFPASGVAGDHTVMRDTSLALVLAATTDERSGQPQILLQRLTVIRYNLPPNSRVVHHDVKSTQQWFNGDLLLKVICQELEAQQLQHQRVV